MSIEVPRLHEGLEVKNEGLPTAPKPLFLAGWYIKRLTGGTLRNLLSAPHRPSKRGIGGDKVKGHSGRPRVYEEAR